MMGSEQNNNNNDLVTGYLELVKSESPNTIRRITLRGNMMTMGRGVQNLVVWENLLQISRKHAEMVYENQTWKLKDLSTNGLMVNGRKIPKDVLVDLRDSDIISFIPTGALQYRYCKLNNNIPKTHPLVTLDAPVTSSPIVLSLHEPSPISSTSTSFQGSPPKRKTIPEVVESPGQSSERDRKRKRLQVNIVTPSRVPSPEEAEEELADIDEVPMFFGDSSNQKDENSHNLIEIESVIENVDDDDDLKSIKEKLKTCQTRIKELEFKNKKLTDEKHDVVESLERKISNAKSETRVFEEELIKKLLDVLEHEFSCCICNEVFIQATVVDCGHTFCGHCISEWVKRKSECPNCRKPIKMQVKHTEMENFITKLHSLLSGEVRQRRQDMVQERNREVESAKVSAATSSTSRNPRGRNGIGMGDFSFTPDIVDLLAELQQIGDMYMPNVSRRATHLGSVPLPGPPGRHDDLSVFNIADFRHTAENLARARAAAIAQSTGASRRRSARINHARGAGGNGQQASGSNQPAPQQQIPAFAQPDFVLRDILTVD